MYMDIQCTCVYTGCYFCIINALAILFSPLVAFGGRFEVTGLIPADQYGQCSSPYYITKSHIWQLTKGLQEILVLQKICNISELNVNKWNKWNTTLK